MKRLSIFLASFAAAAAVGGLGLWILTNQAEQPLPKNAPASQGDDPRLRTVPPSRHKPAFTVLESGLELAEFNSSVKSEIGDSKIHVLRIDPAKFDFRLLCAASANPANPQTARQWCKLDGLVAAINASVLLGKDGRTSVGLMQTRGFSNSKSYGPWRAYLGFDPRDKKAPSVAILNMDLKKLPEINDFKKNYETLVQGARLIPKGGKNFLYKDTSQRWSASAIGIDGANPGRILFIHVRSPYSMKDLVDAVFNCKLGLETLLLTGSGPEAQLFVAAGGNEHEFIGSYKTAVREDDKNDQPPPIPNVIGFVRR